mgnify:FL=1
MILLEVIGLKKYFPIEKSIFKTTGGFVKAVDGVSFSLSEGEVLGVLGESGCGKSTLAKLILRLMKPTSGEIVFSPLLADIRRSVGIIFQDPLLSLDPKMRLRDILREPFLAHKLEISDNKIAELLGLVGLGGDLLRRFPHQLSGGQRQRVCIARSLSLKPKLLVLDEPLSSLDLISQKQILELLHGLRMKFKMSYLFISHNIALIREISDRIMVMSAGKIAEEGKAAEIFNFPKSGYTKKLLEAAS